MGEGRPVFDAKLPFRCSRLSGDEIHFHDSPNHTQFAKCAATTPTIERLMRRS